MSKTLTKKKDKMPDTERNVTKRRSNRRMRTLKTDDIPDINLSMKATLGEGFYDLVPKKN